MNLKELLKGVKPVARVTVHQAEPKPEPDFIEPVVKAGINYIKELIRIADSYKERRNVFIFKAVSALYDTVAIGDFTYFEEVETMNNEEMKQKAVEFLTRELTMLKDYYKTYPKNSGLIRMKEDKIQGAFDMVYNLKLLDYVEYNKIRNDVLNN